MNSALKGLPLAMIAALTLAGCAKDGHYHDRNEDYAGARQTAPLTLPGSRDQSRYRDIMPVPQARGDFYAREGDFAAPLPQTLSASTAVAAGDVAVRETDADRWLVVGAAPAVVWPELERFVEQRGLEITRSDSASGVIETSDASLVLRQGLRSGTSEVRCDTAGQLNRLCLNSLQRHFEARSASASIASASAQQTPEADSVRFEPRGDDWVMVMPFDIERAYAELAFQLENNFEMEDRRELVSVDESGKRFVIDYITESERTRGFIDSLTSMDLLESMQRIELRLSPQGQETLMEARSADDEPLSGDDQRELLQRMEGLLR
ncbi:outer membrane protein assembly factor BamC [Halomonas sp. MMSF_3323]|uniref:outer membrane protein assembly factor BamC n=1 Tax=Halomonas sp. MMSF_3323 TaxID=3046701 RepID=UPI00273DA2F4|nr:outer membrane protein assembly factor BamC [Halomonas sp. MMSF_3323]